MLAQDPTSARFTCLDGCNCTMSGIGRLGQVTTVFPQMPRVTFAAAIGPRPIRPMRTVFPQVQSPVLAPMPKVDFGAADSLTQAKWDGYWDVVVPSLIGLGLIGAALWAGSR